MTRNEAIRYLGEAVAWSSHAEGLSPMDGAIMYMQAMNALGVSGEELAAVGTRAAAEFREAMEQ